MNQIEKVARALCEHAIIKAYTRQDRVEELAPFRAVEVDHLWRNHIPEAKAAIAAMPVQTEPDWWVYEYKGMTAASRTRLPMHQPGETETPLYAHHPVPQEVIAWRYARTDGFVILVSKRYTDQHPKGDGWTEEALGVIPTPMDGGSDGAL